MGMNTDAVQRLYVAYFNRPADPVSLAVYESLLPSDRAATQAELQAIADQYFSPSAEYQTMYAGKSNTQIIDQLYQNIFGRPAEVDGLVYWAAELTAGRQTVASIALQLSYSAQGTDAQVVANRIEAANAFTNSLNTAEEITGYSGDPAAASARSWLQTVGSDDASKDAAIAGVDAAVTNAINATEEVAGKTYTLTSNADIFDTVTQTAANVTTNGDDTFRAVSAGDFTSVDIIDGAGGDDVLTAVMAEGGTTALTVKATLTSVETINITNTAVAGDTTTTLDMGSSTGTTAINVTVANDADFTVTGITTGTAVSFIGTGTADTVATVTLSGLSGAAGGGQDAYTVGLNNADLDDLVLAGVEEVTLNVSGKDVDVADLSAAALEKLVITGGVNDPAVTTENATVGSGTAVDFSGLDTGEIGVIDASGSTGAVVVNITDDQSFSATGGAGKLTIDNTDNGNGGDEDTASATVTAGAGGIAATIQGGGNAAGATAISTVTVTGSDVADTVNIAAVVNPTDLTASGSVNEGNSNNATVTTAGGNDTVTIDAGNVNVNTGDGDDTIIVTTWGSVNAYDTIDMGTGSADAVRTSEATMGASQAATLAKFVGVDVLQMSATGEKTLDMVNVGTVTSAVMTGTHAASNAVAANGNTAGGDGLDFTSNNALGVVTVGALTGQAGQGNNANTAGAGGDALDVNATLDNGSNSVQITLKDNADLTGGAGGAASAGNGNGGAGGDGLDAVEYEVLNLVLAATDTTADTVTITGGSGGAKDGNGTAGAAGNDVVVGTNATINITQTISGTATATKVSSIDLNDIVGTNVTVEASTLTGGVSIDSVQGNTVINTGAGADTIAAGTGVDTINVGAGKDYVDGQTGADMITLGTGSDILNIQESDSTEAAMKKVSDFGLMANGWTASAATDTAAEIQATGVAGTEADMIKYTGAALSVVANKTASDTGVDIGANTDIKDTISNGMLTLSGAGASAVDTLAEWIDQAEAAIGNDEVVAFVFNGNTYVVSNDGGGATVMVIELTGVVASGLAEVAATDTNAVGGAGYVLITGG